MKRQLAGFPRVDFAVTFSLKAQRAFVGCATNLPENPGWWDGAKRTRPNAEHLSEQKLALHSPVRAEALPSTLA